MLQKLSIFISPKKTVSIISCLIAILTLMNVLALSLEPYAVKFPTLKAPIFLWLLEQDGNIPTWYASSTLLICSCLLAIISKVKKKTKDRYFKHWLGLALIFLGLSVDETATIHELINHQMEVRMDTSGFLEWPWVIVGGIFVFIVLLVYLEFLFKLPSQTRFLFILAGTIYVGAALGLEMINANLSDIYNGRSLIYKIVTTIEEFCEMLGVMVFIYALISYLKLHVKQIEICLK